ncbi:MAG: formate dehydrogenase accessory sulfurtransferase FdhD [Bacteroidota bacterium]
MASTVRVSIVKYNEEVETSVQDVLAVEEPLEIRLLYGAESDRKEQAIAITMRTPGNDRDLALGFLRTEGIIQNATQVLATETGPAFLPPAEQNQLLVKLHPSVNIDMGRLERHFFTSSSCGICGKASIDAVHAVSYPPIPAGEPVATAKTIRQLPAVLRKAQEVFEQTGGLHAAGLFDAEGNLQLLREDVGRHNAVDKLVGAALWENQLPLSQSILQLSGRISFELVQKALMAGIPIISAVGAPSSLAVGLAQSAGVTLVGFVRNGRFNVYTCPERIQA